MTGKFTVETKWEEGDFRNSYFAGERLGQLVKRTDSLKRIAQKADLTMVQLALNWVLSHSEVSTVIPGMRNVSYVEDNAGVSDLERLSDDIMEELKKHRWERNFYSGLDPQLKESGFVEG